MRNPANVLNSLSEHSKLKDYKFERLYRILFNEEMYFIAYQSIYANPGNMTKGSDGSTTDGMSLDRIKQIIDTLKDESYQPQPSRRVYIEKKNGKKRPLGIPSFNDKLVQEIIRMVLTAIYENSFEHTSHGFRPKRSCHTALKQIQNTFNGAKWFIEGDIKGFFDNINHDVLLKILQERINDERFIRLIRKFLNAGYIEDWTFHRTYSGTPQGGIISPILANIYLDKLDKYMRDYIYKFDRGDKRTPHPERIIFEWKRVLLVKKLKIAEDEAQRRLLIEKIRAIEKERILIPSGDEMDTSYKRLKYVRYADDFLIGVIGSIEECRTIKEDIRKFLEDKLKLELSEEKTLITHTEKSAIFLSYDIHVRNSNLTKRDKMGRLTRSYNKKIVMKIPADAAKKKLIEYRAIKFTYHNGKEQWKPYSRPFLLQNDDLEILSRYNAEIRGFYNYYSLALNVGSLNSFKYIMEYSMYKTFARKYQVSVPKICDKYMVNKMFTVFYKNKKGEQKMRTFYSDGFKKRKDSYLSTPDNFPNLTFTFGRTNLIDRLKASKCELCGETENLDMHHIRKLSDIKGGKKPWQVRMLARQRKTIAVCHQCHTKIHNGMID
ncbi:reverse transcriptase/maturase family protein [Chryseobacterium sp.]|uniref:reverse transcriptase/maturase family protein n=1 Tax=Chryseobacterium sp. TaxID=1871047 RepID=UPI001B15106E|nr:reverse transcriptase/maturase family protein [Chryseobacterium sp.]MBO9692994.1 group II intron reverse transcriptase/maturase [Chryseobacterium sp.]